MEIKFYEEKEISGIRGWYWISQDVQTWNIIARDWVNSHYQTIADTIEKYGKKYGTVVQAGGNCGMYPNLLSLMFKNVYTFEPDPVNFLTLCMNCRNNNIYKMQAGVGSESGLLSMVYRTMQNVGMHQTTVREDSTIPMIALDNLKFPKVDLLWFDIEDFEIHALKGSKNLIKNDNPIVMCENPTEEVIDFMLSEFDYKLVGRSMMDGVFFNQ